MADEKILPPGEAVEGQDIFSGGPVPATRDGRIKLTTERGGLKSCPNSFRDEYLDWEIIKADNPFEVLYLDYRVYDRISRAMIDGNFTVIKKFWTDIAAKAMSSPPVANKYGGMDSIRRYLQILQKAYDGLTADANALKKCFEQIIQNKQESLRPSIESILIQGEYTPGIRKDVTQKGIEIGITGEEVESLLIGVLKEKGFAPELEDSNDPLSVRWYSEARRKAGEEANVESLKKELDSIIEGILADGVYEPRELSSVMEKGKQIGNTENEVLTYFEKKLLEQGFSHDPDADIKGTDAIHKKLSAIWRTNEKHLEVSGQKFQTFLDGKLNNGIYTPDDYLSITEAATGLLRRDSVKLKAMLIDYLKEKGFKPVGEFQPGNDLAVEWRTDWAKKKFEGSQSPAKIPRKKPFLKIAIVLGIVAVIAAGLLNMKKGQVPPRVEPPQPPVALASITIKTQPGGAAVFLNGSRKGNSPITMSKLKKGNYTIRLELQGYEAKEEHVSLNNESQRVEITLEKVKPPQPQPPVALASITIKTQPRGAAVFLNGSRKGNSPITIPDLKKGNYTIRLELQGYEAKEEYVSLNNESQRVEIMMEKVKPPSPPLPGGERDTPEIKEYLAEGIKYYKDAEYKLCIQNMKEVLKRDKNHPIAKDYIRMAEEKLEKTNGGDPAKDIAEGKSLFEKGMYRECIEIMNRVLQKNPNNSTAKFYISKASKKIEKSTELSDPSGGTTKRRW